MVESLHLIVIFSNANQKVTQCFVSVFLLLWPVALLFLFLPRQFPHIDLKAVSQLPEQLAVPQTQLGEHDFLLVSTTDALMWYRYLPFRNTVRRNNLFSGLIHTLTRAFIMYDILGMLGNT